MWGLVKFYLCPQKNMTKGPGISGVMPKIDFIQSNKLNIVINSVLS